MPGIVRSQDPFEFGKKWIAEPAEAFTVLQPGPIPINIPEANIPPSGLVGAAIGRTTAEATANTPFGLAATGDNEVYLIAFPSPDPDEPACTVLRPGTLIYHEMVPGWADLSADVKALVLARYQGIRYPLATV